MTDHAPDAASQYNHLRNPAHVPRRFRTVAAAWRRGAGGRAAPIE